MTTERRQLRMQLPDELVKLADIFRQNDRQLYVVGGAVRDAVLGHQPKDFDVATDATPAQVKELLRPYGYSMLEVGEAFGVVALVLPHPLEKLEIATFREDMSEGRHPVVRFASIEEDVKRRDLTINALFYDISRGEVVDLVGGLRDLEEGWIKTVGAPADRFREDRLRILRTIRFANKLDFLIDPQTWEAILADNNLDGVSPERIHDELTKSIASAQNSRRLFNMFDRLKMWPRVLPLLTVTPVPDVQVSSSGVESRNVPVALAVLLDTNPIPHVARRLNALKYSGATVAQVCFLLQFKDLNCDNAYKLWKQFQHSHLTPDDLVEYVRERGLPDQQVFNAFMNYVPAINGTQLLAEGFKGAELGRELERRETVRFRELHDESR